MTTRVFIYGGCTSRDTVEYYPQYGLVMHSYIARQSLISAFHPVNPKYWNLSSIESSFQRRMVRWDIIGKLRQHLRDNAHEIDLVVWDLMIERVGVPPAREKGYVTNNPQTRKHAAPGTLGEVIEFGTDEHLELWDDALSQFMSVLNQTGLRNKIVVNATPWALVDKRGTAAHYPNAGMSPQFFNQTVQQYWEMIEQRGIKVIRLPQEDAIADPEHRWGPAYFHYAPPTYIAQLEALPKCARPATPPLLPSERSDESSGRTLGRTSVTGTSKSMSEQSAPSRSVS